MFGRTNVCINGLVIVNFIIIICFPASIDCHSSRDLSGICCNFFGFLVSHQEDLNDKIDIVEALALKLLQRFSSSLTMMKDGSNDLQGGNSILLFVAFFQCSMLVALN